MGSELLKMADGFALVAESLRELAGQAVEEAEAETQQESRTEKGIADKNTAGVKANKKKEEQKVAVEDIRVVLAEKSQEGKTKEIKELLGRYGVAKLSAVEEKDYPALLVEAKVL
uniref:hypothetical protein n=1 Tax=Enterocloster clostridioformis TaxID=1531 RepID=UPI001C3C7042|nr:hypothetical protein [Enterocloster clostridioformis]